MTPPTDPNPHELFRRLVDGDATPDDHRALNRALRDSAEARRDYLDYLRLHAMLDVRLGAQAPAGQPAASDLGDKARGKPSPCRATPAHVLPTPPAKPAATKQARPMSFLRDWRTWALAAMLVLAVPAFGIFSYIFRDTGSASRPRVADRADAVAVLFEISEGAEFTFDGPGDRDNNLATGRPVPPGVVDLKYGSLTFRFHSNAEVTIKGPARFGLNDGYRAHLHEGRLTAFCPPEARGFTVGAPGVAVVDLGTRFTMFVDAFGFAEISVVDGEVRLDRPSGESVALATGGAARAPRDLALRMIIDQPTVAGRDTQPAEIVQPPVPAEDRELLTWAGDSSSTQFLDEVNWTLGNEGPPPPGTIEGAMESRHIIPYDLYIGPGAIVDIPQSTRLRLGDGGRLTVDSATVTGQSNTHFMPTGPDVLDATQTITLKGTTQFTYGWAWDTHWILQDHAQLVATNFNTSPVSGCLGKRSELHFDSPDTSFTLTLVPLDLATARDWLDKMYVNGKPAKLDANLKATPANDGQGTRFTPIFASGPQGIAEPLDAPPHVKRPLPLTPQGESSH